MAHSDVHFAQRHPQENHAFHNPRLDSGLGAGKVPNLLPQASDALGGNEVVQITFSTPSLILLILIGKYRRFLFLKKHNSGQNPKTVHRESEIWKAHLSFCFFLEKNIQLCSNTPTSLPHITSLPRGSRRLYKGWIGCYKGQQPKQQQQQLPSSSSAPGL